MMAVRFRGKNLLDDRVLVRVEHLPQPNGLKTVRMIPGMTASAQIKTGKKTVLAFLLKPFNQAREAFRER